MPPTSKQIKKRGDDQLSTNLSGHKVVLLNDIAVIISLMNYSAQRFDSAQLQTLTFSNTKGAASFIPFITLNRLSASVDSRVRSLPHI